MLSRYQMFSIKCFVIQSCFNGIRIFARFSGPHAQYEYGGITRKPRQKSYRNKIWHRGQGTCQE